MLFDNATPSWANMNCVMSVNKIGGENHICSSSLPENIWRGSEIPQALGYTLWFSLFSLKLNIFPFSASILTFSTQKLNHLILTYFTHFDTTHFFYKYYNINKASNSPPFFWLLYIMKFHQPRFNSRFLHGMSLSRRNSRGRRFLVYCSVYSTR